MTKIGTTKKYVFLLLISLIPVQSYAQENDPPLSFEEALMEIDIPIDATLAPVGTDLRDYQDPEPTEEEMLAYQGFIENFINGNENQTDIEIDLPNANELLDYARMYRNEGSQALIETALFNPFLSSDAISDTVCETFIPAIFLTAARKIEPDSGLDAQVLNILTERNQDEAAIEELLGAEWSIEVPQDYVDPDDLVGGEAINLELEDNSLFFDDMSQQISLMEEDGTLPDDISTPAGQSSNPLVIKKPIAARRNLGNHNYLDLACDKMTQNGQNNKAWFKYNLHTEFTIHYQLCGDNSITADVHENFSNTVYLMPNWSVVKLTKCTEFNSKCAPMHIQMIAADVLYQRRVFGREGYKLPGHWNITIASDDPDKGSYALFGVIELNGPALTSLGLRRLVFHEYFHAIQTKYGSEGAWLGNGEITGRRADFRKNSMWWAQLESLASWASFSIGLGDNPYPTYIENRVGGTISDARNHLFESSYHPLEYAYIAERFSLKGNKKPSSCLGCDTIKEYLNILENGYWQKSLAAVNFLLVAHAGRQVYNQLGNFIRDYHLDLLFSRMDRKWGTKSGDFRFLNSQAPVTNTLWPTLEAWPPQIQTVPHLMKSNVGLCSDKSLFQRGNATQVDGKYIQGFTCSAKMSPSGAIYLDIPVDVTNLPDKIMLAAVGVKVHPEDVNKSFAPFKILPGELINGKLRVFSIPAELLPETTLQFDKTKPLGLYVNKFSSRNYTIDLKSKHSDANHLYLVIDYPSLDSSWINQGASLPAEVDNFMARIIVVGYWNN